MKKKSIEIDQSQVINTTQMGLIDQDDSYSNERSFNLLNGNFDLTPEINEVETPAAIIDGRKKTHIQ